MTHVYQSIIEKLDSNSIEYTTEHHEAIESSEQTSRDRGMDLHAGAKAIVVVGSKTGTSYMCILPGDAKLDNAKTKEVLGEKVGFSQDVVALTGCVPGSVPPFGSLFDMKTFVDEQLADNEFIFFNAGSLTDTIKMRYDDWLAVEQPIVASIAKPIE